MSQSVLAVTLGDPAGIGPEIVVKAWAALKDSGPAFSIGAVTMPLTSPASARPTASSIQRMM